MSREEDEIAKRIWERFMQGMIDDAKRQTEQIKRDNPELAKAMEEVDKIENKREFLEQLPPEELERLREISGVGDLMKMINL